MNTLPPLDIPRKPHYITISTDHDFFALFQKIAARYPTCFLLESLGEEAHFSRYSLIGFDPDMCIRAKENTLFVTERHGTQHTLHHNNPYQLLANYLPTNTIAHKYAGGLTGYLNYDCINYFEPSLNVTPHSHFDSFHFGLYLDGLLLDKMTGELIYFYYQHNRLSLIHELIQTVLPTQTAFTAEYLGDSMTQAEHAEAVINVKEAIKAGRLFQCEVGFKSHYKVAGNALELYQRLRQINPSPHMYFLQFNDQKIVGASPELLFRLRQGEMETFPLAGTTKRGTTHAEDLLLARTLLNDPKEIAEHNMLVDLHRNDLGRVAKLGSVKVRSLMDIKRFSHVQHISSEISGLLAEGETMFSALAANFPAGTLSGAPKIEAIKMIDTLEKSGRGPYGGAVGTFSLNGDCTFAIPIRSIFIHGEDAYIQTCGGNVYDSNATDEYQEIQRKLAGMKMALAPFIQQSPQGENQ